MPLWPRSIEPFSSVVLLFFFIYIQIYLYVQFMHILHSLKYMESKKVCKAGSRHLGTTSIKRFFLTLIFF